MLLGAKDRAELAGRTYKALSSVMEGVVIVQLVPEEADAAAATAGNGSSMSVV